jgi:asparagine N-glycosylation enzyme membrane subunit Stt3
MRSERLRTAALCVSLVALAVWVRALQRALVLTPGGVVPVDGDSFYHFRRIAWSVHNFPGFLSVDPYVNFPRGGEPIWSPTFDFVLAALVRGLLGVGSDGDMERLLCWVPALLGGLHVALLYLLGRRFLSGPAAVAGALLLAFLPAHSSYSQVGFVDHHVAVSLAGSLVLFAALHFAARPGRREAVWLGLAFAGSLLVWPGGLIQVAVAQAALLAFCLSRSEGGHAAEVARRLAAAHLLAAAAVAPLCLGRTWVRWGDLSPLVLSNFQPLWLAAGALSFAGLAEVWRRAGFPRGPLGRAAGALAVGAAVAVLAVALFPELAGAAAPDAWAWLARGEEFQAVVKESQPLLWRNGELRLRSGVVFLSGGLLLAPVAAAVLVWRARAASRPELGVLAAWAIAFVALALAQKRFAVDAAPALALLLPAAVDAGLAAAPRSRRRLLAALAVSVGLALYAPLLLWYETRPAAAARRARRMALTLDAARWLRAHSPPTAGWLAPGPPPAYGVLGPWGAGHALRYVAQRPVVQDNFGDDVGGEGFAAAEAYFSAESEPAGVAILEQLRVRYVLVGRSGSGHGRGYGPTSLLARLRREGAVTTRGGAAQPPDPPLVRHRLVYESEPLDSRPRGPHWKLFELVPAPPPPAASETAP